jgi:hypothetical protein
MKPARESCRDLWVSRFGKPLGQRDSGAVIALVQVVEVRD